MLGSIGWPELLVIFLILLLLFGSRMPEIGRSLGKGIKSFKDGLAGVADEKPAAAAAGKGEEKAGSPVATDTLTPSSSDGSDGEGRAG